MDASEGIKQGKDGIEKNRSRAGSKRRWEGWDREE
jgi:hypothetical protein